MSVENNLKVKFLSNDIIEGICYYQISITDIISRETWIIKDRYKNLRNIHKKLKSSFNSPLPDFPRKKWPGNLEPSFISQRQKHLENYLNLILSDKTISNFPNLTAYLFKERKSDESKINEKSELTKNNFKNSFKLNKFNNGGFKIIDELNKKFLDLTVVLNLPEEDEIKKKKNLYEKININIKENKKSNLPTGNERNLIHIYQESLVNSNKDNLILFDNCIRKIEENCSLDIKSNIVHKMNS